eukprot:10444-Chlamydomonas_euryale.AAC.1
MHKPKVQQLLKLTRLVARQEPTHVVRGHTERPHRGPAVAPTHAADHRGARRPPLRPYATSLCLGNVSTHVDCLRRARAAWLRGDSRPGLRHRR